MKALWEWRLLQWKTNLAHLHDCISCEVDYVFCVSVAFNVWLFCRLFPVSRMAASVPTDLEITNSWEMWSVSLDPFEVGVCLVAFIGVFVFVKLRHREPVHLHLPLREFVKGHSFVPTDLFAYPSYCNICEENVVEGFQCGKVFRLIVWLIDWLNTTHTLMDYRKSVRLIDYFDCSTDAFCHGWLDCLLHCWSFYPFTYFFDIHRCLRDCHPSEVRSRGSSQNAL